VSEQRCAHGFLRSVIPCPSCDGGLSPNAKARENASQWQQHGATARRGQAQPHGLTGTYRCNCCGMTKPLSEFYVARGSRLGHQGRCKSCDNNKRVQRLQRSRGPYV
jgi:hypothetical protein